MGVCGLGVYSFTLLLLFLVGLYCVGCLGDDSCLFCLSWLSLFGGLVDVAMGSGLFLCIFCLFAWWGLGAVMLSCGLGFVV